eukprot:gene6046-10047_t
MEEIFEQVEKRKHAKDPFKNKFVDLVTSDFRSKSIYEAGYELDIRLNLISQMEKNLMKELEKAGEKPERRKTQKNSIVQEQNDSLEIFPSIRGTYQSIKSGIIPKEIIDLKFPPKASSEIFLSVDDFELCSILENENIIIDSHSFGESEILNEEDVLTEKSIHTVIEFLKNQKQYEIEKIVDFENIIESNMDDSFENQSEDIVFDQSNTLCPMMDDSLDIAEVIPQMEPPSVEQIEFEKPTERKKKRKKDENENPIDDVIIFNQTIKKKLKSRLTKIKMNISVKDNLSFYKKIDKIEDQLFDFDQSKVVKGLNLFEKKKQLDENIFFETDLVMPSNDIENLVENHESIDVKMKLKNKKRMNIKKISSIIYDKIQEKNGKLNYENIESMINQGNNL